MKIKIEIEVSDASVYSNRDSWPAVIDHIHKAASNTVNAINQTFDLDATLIEVEEYYGNSHN